MSKRRVGTVTRKPHRLAGRWCPVARDFLADCSPRFGNADLRYLMDVFSKDVLAELDRRGYDLATLRFHVDKTPAAIAEHERAAGR